MEVREARPEDFRRIEQILSESNMLGSPEVDGIGAMVRVRERMGRYFLVAEVERRIVGMLRGCYDGSRALVHQMVVDENYRSQGVGKKLINEVASRFKADGASTVSVTATDDSISYYEGAGFSELPITLMVAPDIMDVIERTRD